jgi:DNA-binding CsgD family transcriptional regulator
MTTRTRDGFWALTEKEKQTLRLIVRGHDAKSSARSLGLSVHTINERLRDARRKMAVSSSREAARMLLEAENGMAAAPPDLFGDAEMGEDAGTPPQDQEVAPISGVGRARRRSWIFIGVTLMTLALALLAFIAPPQGAAPSPPPATSAEAPDAAVVDAARHWLALLDQSRWDESYRATAASFRALNTPQVWAAVSERVRAPLGATLSRSFVSEEEVPTPPHGYEMVKFRTRFANKAEVVETVTLEQADGVWRVAGVTVG